MLFKNRQPRHVGAALAMCCAHSCPTSGFHIARSETAFQEESKKGRKMRSSDFWNWDSWELVLCRLSSHRVSERRTYTEDKGYEQRTTRARHGTAPCTGHFREQPRGSECSKQPFSETTASVKDCQKMFKSSCYFYDSTQAH